MTRRSKKSQSAHDKEVLRQAQALEKKGFDVKADVAGYKKPPTFGGLRPDVVAKKGRERKIIEVETTESKSSARDLKQQQAFRRAAKRSKSTTFRRIVVKKD